MKTYANQARGSSLLIKNIDITACVYDKLKLAKKIIDLGADVRPTTKIAKTVKKAGWEIKKL